MPKTRYPKLFALLISTLMINSCTTSGPKEEIQITHDLSYNHDLDNNDNFSPNDEWLVYDIRTDEGGIGGCSRIEKVNLKTGEKVVLYELKQNQSYGPGAGAVSYSHTENKVVFIHGLLNITKENSYQQWRRSGVIIDDANPGIPIFMDSRDVTEPFTTGALRGGTHRHEWSRDGGWIGYTYNDAIMKQLEDSTSEIHNLRAIGVSKEIKLAKVEEDAEGENISGGWYSALVVKVVANPTPGTDEISRAAGDSWVGISGYKRADGNTQRARAFIGTVKDEKGKDIDEVFIVDIPDDITIAGEDGPLEGTLTAMPSTPKGASQRRLTFTANSEKPGCTGIVRSSADGSKLAFLASDKNGIQQIFTISPEGGQAIQQTFHDSDVQSGVRWHPNGNEICYVWDNSIISKTVDGTKVFSRLTNSTALPPANLVWSHDGLTIAFNRKVKNEAGALTKQIFIIKL
jgi:hypothetical protein